MPSVVQLFKIAATRVVKQQFMYSDFPSPDRQMYCFGRKDRNPSKETLRKKKSLDFLIERFTYNPKEILLVASQRVWVGYLGASVMHFQFFLHHSLGVHASNKEVCISLQMISSHSKKYEAAVPTG